MPLASLGRDAPAAVFDVSEKSSSTAARGVPGSARLNCVVRQAATATFYNDLEELSFTKRREHVVPSFRLGVFWILGLGT